MTQSPGNSFNFRPRNATLGYQSSLDSTTLASFFNAVYAWMSAGLGVTALVAWVVAHNPDLRVWAMNGPVLLISVLVELGLVFAISGAINRISASAATAMFMLYSAINGFLFSILFLRYTTASLTGTFVVTAGVFGAMSIYGYTTKRDLTRLGSLLFMALIGLVLASVVNVFMHSPLLYWGVTYAGVLIFVGLTAYDTQRLREIASETISDPRMAARMAVVGSLMLYLDFINLFLMLLRLLGNSRRD